MSPADEPLATDVLFVGMTRPTMVFGVTYEAFVVETVAVGVVFLAVGNPLYLAIGLPLHAVGYLVCLADPQAFRLVWLWLRTKGRCRTSRFWRASTRSPLRLAPATTPAAPVV